MSPADPPTWGFRLDPRTWLRLAPEIRRTPDDVVLGAKVFFSVGGHDEGPTHRRFAAAGAAHLVDEGVPYPALFTDYDALRALPAGTLGREYVRELDARQIRPLELALATQRAYTGLRFSAAHAYVRDRVRNAHDLFHTLTGYGIDVNGESGVLAFTFGQTGNKGWLSLVLINALACIPRGRFDLWRVAWKGYRRGRAARFLPGVESWDRLLRLPLEQARTELGIPPLEPYEPIALAELYGSGTTEAA